MLENSDINLTDNKDLYCADLPSKPLKEAGIILVTGASGYIGGRLIYELLNRGYKVRIMVRGEYLTYTQHWPKAEVVVADALSLPQLKKALDGVETAYYLIHSLYLGPKDFEAADKKAAINFRKAAREKGLKRIIYLGGLGDVRSDLSSHLRSRMTIARELQKGLVPVTILRAAIIIGSGSASYEIIKHLALNLPIVLIPAWAKNQCQPIAIRDVIKYLIGVLEVAETSGKSFDIGGSDVLSYKQMLETVKQLLDMRTIFIPFPVFSIKIYAYFASLLTPVPNTITQCLMEGLKNKVICQDNSIKEFIDFKLLSYRDSLLRAFAREDQEKVYTRWSNAYLLSARKTVRLYQIKDNIKYGAKFSLSTKKKASDLFNSICRIGGRAGWFHGNWMWRLRGMIDRLLLGVGTARGRRNYSRLEINDVIDFWRIEDIIENRRLLLRAEMKLPGVAWLEFKISDTKKERKLSVIAYYDTNNISGVLYWYLCLPFHYFIFKKLIEAIEARS